MKYRNVALVVGILVTAFMGLVFLPKLIGSIIENGLEHFKVIGYNILHWYDNPTGFFLSYFLGYIIVWRNQLIGSLTIIAASLLVLSINYDNLGFIIFAGPTIIVGVLYYLTWKSSKRELETAS